MSITYVIETMVDGEKGIPFTETKLPEAMKLANAFCDCADEVEIVKFLDGKEQGRMPFNMYTSRPHRVGFR
jgi:hypothetical protein